MLWRYPILIPVMWRLWEWSLFNSPYRASKRHPQLATDAHQHTLTYGEIALPTVDKIFDTLKLRACDKLLDLGSGRGRVVLLAAAKGYVAHGIEILPGLVETANYAAAGDLSLASFVEGDFLNSTWPEVAVIWAVGTCWDQDTRQQLIQKLIKLAEHTLIISVSLPFLHANLPVQCMIRGWTNWGRDRFYIQKVTHTTLDQ